MDRITLAGSYRLRAWKPGELEHYIAKGHNLQEALQKFKPFADLLNHNTITLVGKELAAAFLIGTSVTGLTYMAIGTDNTTPTAGDTVLGTETYRQVWDTRTRINNGITLDVLIAAANCTAHIQEGGVFGGAASGTPDSGTLFSRYLQDFDNSVSAYDLTFDYQLTVG